MVRIILTMLATIGKHNITHVRTVWTRFRRWLRLLQWRQGAAAEEWVQEQGRQVGDRQSTREVDLPWSRQLRRPFLPENMHNNKFRLQIKCVLAIYDNTIKYNDTAPIHHMTRARYRQLCTSPSQPQPVQLRVRQRSLWRS